MTPVGVERQQAAEPTLHRRSRRDLLSPTDELVADDYTCPANCVLSAGLHQKPVQGLACSRGTPNLRAAAALIEAHACASVSGCDGPTSSPRSPVVAAAGGAVRVPELPRAHVRGGVARRVCVLPQLRIASLGAGLVVGSALVSEPPVLWATAMWASLLFVLSGHVVVAGTGVNPLDLLGAGRPPADAGA